MKFSDVVIDKKDDIIQVWIERVCQDDAIQSSQDLTYRAVLDSLPKLIDAIAHLLSHPSLTKNPSILESDIRHVEERANQGYDAEEIVREYAILRDVIFDVLEIELLQSEPSLLLKTTRLIDGAVDKVIAFCLKRFTEERLRDVDLLYGEMVASNQELDRLLRNEQTNLTYLAHELKSPLSCIIGYSDLFLRQQSSEEVNISFIERVLSSGRKLLEMINDTLEVSSYKAGQITIQPEPVQICEVVKEVATVLDTLAQQKGLALAIACDPIDETITTDKARLRQVVTNLISNAIRYTETGGIRVEVRATDAGGNSLSLSGNSDHNGGGHGLTEGSVEIAVTDTGLGIEVAEQARIFEPYYQGESGQKLPGSTGLGLAIAHQMVKLLQGDIHLHSKPDEGSTFTVTLPLHLNPESYSQIS